MLLVSFALLYIFSKLVNGQFRYYKAAIAYSVSALVISVSYKFITEGIPSDIMTYAIAVGVAFALRLLLSTLVFYLLERFSETIFLWLLVFGVGGTLLLFLF